MKAGGKQGDIPQPPPLKKGGWLGTNMAQLMVFLNGLILTATAFATLNIFIKEIVYDGLEKNAIEIDRQIDEELSNAERTLMMIGATLSLQSPDAPVRLTTISLQSLERAKISQLYVLHKEPDGRFTIGLLNASQTVQYGKQLPVYKTLALDNFLHFIARDQFTTDATSRFYTDLPGLRADTSGMGLGPAAIAVPIFYDGVQHGIMIGVITINDMVPYERHDTESSLKNIIVRTIDDKKIIYRYAAEGSDKIPLDTLYRRSFESEISDERLIVEIGILPGGRENFLIKIPLLMLLFGITLTLIGTLYVRNNQRQSQKLSAMNRELAQKNYELHSQMSEGERLNQFILKQEKDNRAIIDSVSDIIFETAANGDILFLNETWERVTGFKVEQSLRRNIFDMLYLQDQQEQRQNFELMVLGKKKSYRTFTRLRTSEGTFRSVELAVSMIRQDDSKQLRVVGTMTDVEERRRAERALAEAEKKYRAIVENAAGGIYQVTPEGIFLSANPAAARILGYDTPEAMLREVRNVNTQLYNDPAARERFLGDVAHADRPLQTESQMVRADGLVIWVNENLRSVKDEEQMLLYYEGSLEDITQRKQAEIAMARAKTESDLASRAKSEFLANMSHELRTPLNAIIGFSEIIKNETFGPLGKKEYWDYANDIYGSGKRLLSVINEILDVSRIQAGERELNEGIVNVQRLVSSCIDMMRGKIETGRLTINNQLEHTDMQLIGEAQAIKQMILNLLSNAVKFTPEGGMLTMSGELDDAGQYRLSITDTGLGLSEDELKKALTPFGQIDSDHNRKKSGTGLGLTLVDALIALHGGSLELISQKNIGTTATLVFPAKRVNPKTPSAKLSAVDKLKEDL